MVRHSKFDAKVLHHWRASGQVADPAAEIAVIRRMRLWEDQRLRVRGQVRHKAHGIVNPANLLPLKIPKSVQRQEAVIDFQAQRAEGR